MRITYTLILSALLFPSAASADDIGRAQPRILNATHQIMDAADSIKERQVNLESKFKYLIKSVTGDRRNIYIRFFHETETLHGRARDLDTNKTLDRVGLQKTRLEKEIVFLQTYDVVMSTANEVATEMNKHGADSIARGVFNHDLRPALRRLGEALPLLDAYAGYRLQRSGSRRRIH